jgi:ribonuclease HI
MAERAGAGAGGKGRHSRVSSFPVAIAHLDESCLGNGREGATPGGAAGLIETRAPGGRLVRRDFYLSEPDTTNNRMALAGAVVALRLMAAKGNRLRVLIVSDSEYLVRGMREWVPGWIGRGWKRKAGPIENLELWQALVEAAALHDTTFTWVRGHAGHPRNEYANDLAVRAARTQVASDGLLESGFDAWLAAHRAGGRYLDYDEADAYRALEQRLFSGERLALDAGA